ncbi:unnamed protein product, partial [Ectocarpus sp. 13 AM-2016]
PRETSTTTSPPYEYVYAMLKKGCFTKTTTLRTESLTRSISGFSVPCVCVCRAASDGIRSLHRRTYARVACYTLKKQKVARDQASQPPRDTRGCGILTFTYVREIHRTWNNPSASWH